MKSERLLLILEKLKNSVKFNKHSLGILQKLSYFRKLNLITNEEYLYMLTFLRDIKPTPNNRYKDFFAYGMEFWGNSVLSSNWFKYLLDEREINHLRKDYLKRVIYDVKQSSITTGRKIIILNKLKNCLLNHDSGGMCGALNSLNISNKITYIESEIIKSFLFFNKPTRLNEYKEFTQNKHWVNTKFWWSPIDEEIETRKVRIDYLNKLIANIK